MKNILQFISKHYASFLFLILEIIAFSLIVNYHNNHRLVYLSSSSKVVGSIHKFTSGISRYFDLRESNTYLATENAKLLNLLETEQAQFKHENDTSFNFIPSYVINNSTSLSFNYLTLDKGIKDGVNHDMGIISKRCVVGIVVKTSENYSTALSMLNPHLKLSAKLDGTDFFGSVSWDGQNLNEVVLDEVPEHAMPSVGQRIVTSGYSAIFPEGMLIGTVADIEHIDGDSFLKIKVKLAVDFTQLNHVDIITNSLKAERVELEEDTEQ